MNTPRLHHYALAALLVIALQFLTGCHGIATASGGKSSVKLADGTEVGSAQGDNAATPTTQSIKRARYYPSRRPAPVSPLQAESTPEQAASVPPAPFAPYWETEQIETTVGATQDVSGIVRAANSNRPTVAAVLLSIGLGWAAWRAWRRGWPLVAGIAGAGAVVCALTLSPWWGLASLVVAGLVWVAYTIGAASNPLIAAAGKTVSSAI